MLKALLILICIFLIYPHNGHSNPCVKFLGKKFSGEIKHPDLYLWDNWGFKDGNVIHRYSLASPRAYTPQERHSHAHWQHFISLDQGKSWIEQGPILKPSKNKNSFFSQSIWSGHVLKLSNESYIAAYTGISKNAPYEQAIGIIRSNTPYHFSHFPKVPLLSANLHKQELTRLGYYFDYKNLGEATERDGTIMALRDPFLFEGEKFIQMFFAAKSIENGKIQSSIGQALISKKDLKITKILPPIKLPDADQFTQVELPNVFIRDNKKYILISTTNRTNENQSIIDTKPSSRLYQITKKGAIIPSGHNGASVILQNNTAYGMNVIGPANKKAFVFSFNEEFKGNKTQSYNLPSPISFP